MTTITLHGAMAEAVGRGEWRLEVKSIQEAIYAIESQCRGKLMKFLTDAANKTLEYKILVNQRAIIFPEDISIEKPETIINSELMMINENLETLDFVPIIRGAGGGGGGGGGAKGIILLVLAVILIATGLGAFGGGALLVATAGGMSTFATALVAAGIGLAVTGISLLLMQPPKFDDFRKIDNGRGGTPSYLFDGPTNVVGEGGPVPVGYGRLLIGSTAIHGVMQVVEYPILTNVNEIVIE